MLVYEQNALHHLKQKNDLKTVVTKKTPSTERGWGGRGENRGIEQETTERPSTQEIFDLCWHNCRRNQE
jgi:hypothetical protein